MRIACVLIVFLCSASSILSAQEDANAVQSKIIALEKAWNQAYKHADRKALDRILDDRIVLVNDDGSVQTKAEFLASVTKSNAQQQQVSPESVSVQVFGNTAISVGVFQAKGIGRGNYMLHTLIAELLAIRAWNLVFVDCSSETEKQAALNRTIRTAEIIRSILEIASRN